MYYYAGIGARKTPAAVLETFDCLGEELARLGIVLRSGAANGADTAFEQGCDKCNGPKEIYLPWKGFNGSNFEYHNPTQEAVDTARKFWNTYGRKPWDEVPDGDKKLLARDAHQVLGVDLATPSNFVVCWTPGGKLVGGTAMALHIAKYHGIKVFNAGIYTEDDWSNWESRKLKFVSEVLSYAKRIRDIVHDN